MTRKGDPLHPGTLRPPLMPPPQSSWHELRWHDFTAGELIAAREHLNVSGGWLAGALGVTDRTVRNWEAGRTEVPPVSAALIRDLLAYTTRAEEALISRFRPSNRLRPVLWTYRSDADMRAAHPGALDRLYWPASWYRALYARVVRAGVPCRIAIRPAGYVAESGDIGVPWGTTPNPSTEKTYVTAVVELHDELVAAESAAKELRIKSP
jgi:transcriptional regulator with XRE-family HTH domain